MMLRLAHMNPLKIALVSVTFFSLASCAHAPVAAGEARTARAPLESKSGSSVTGTAEFVQTGNDVVLTLTVAGATPGKHAAHVHVMPDCSDPEAKAAGDHWNPSHEDHGQFDVAPFHLGDIGNLDVGADGTGSLRLTTSRWSIGTGAENDLLKHSVVVHASVDDLKTNPSGNSGGRQACGVIEQVK